MYLKGYRITTSKNTQSITLPKWDFGCDKSLTNSVWNNTLESLRAISEIDYPLLIIDLDKPDLPETQIKDKIELENWLNRVMK